jgi:hypothetical protein
VKRKQGNTILNAIYEEDSLGFSYGFRPGRSQHQALDALAVALTGFQAQTEADRFLEDLRERLGKFGLELHPEKTRRFEFGRFAELNRQRRGEGKPETFASPHLGASGCLVTAWGGAGPADQPIPRVTHYPASVIGRAG